MYKLLPRILTLVPILVLLICLRTTNFSASSGEIPPGMVVAAKQSTLLLQGSQPVFRYPVVKGSTISGYFDHNQADGMVTFYNGRRNNPGAGFYFQCSNPAMYDWVGCESNVAGEPACANNRELWYDEHHGTDYEYSSGWHTGAFCDPGRFAGITANVYAPARGRVFFAGYDANRPANGWHIRLQHDLNENGNFWDDNFRSVYLHFSAYGLAVSAGQIVAEGQYLGLGGSTGYSSSPHLHFEVQRSNDGFQYSYWPVDPYGWNDGIGADPWPYRNVNLFRIPEPIPMPYHLQLPGIVYQRGCADCGELLSNNGFEDGLSSWVEETQDIIVDTSYSSLPIAPYDGSWLAWLGGRNDATDVVYQDFTVPEGTNGARLRYMLYVSTDETGGALDYFYVRLRLPDGTVIQELEQQDNTFGQKGQWVQRSFNLSSLPAYAGQVVRIQFKGTTDGSSLTNFFIDDVSIVASQ